MKWLIALVGLSSLILQGCTFMSSDDVDTTLEIKPQEEQVAVSPTQDTMCFGEVCYDVEIADEPQERRDWLMRRESMPDDHGMLFVFPENGIHRFWMKNTLIPLDMIWLDEEMTVVHVETDVPPCKADPCPSYWPFDIGARYVLELNAWQIELFEIEVWDQMIWTQI